MVVLVVKDFRNSNVLGAELNALLEKHFCGRDMGLRAFRLEVALVVIH